MCRPQASRGPERAPRSSSDVSQGGGRASAAGEATSARTVAPGQGRGRGRASRDVTGRSPKQHRHTVLGFTYDHPAQRMGAGAAASSGTRRAGAGRHAPGQHSQQQRARKFRKSDFLHANFRFVVSDRVDARRYLERADEAFDWADVLQVEVSGSEPLQCPVTLECPPVVPVMTACGHAFSLAAIVHCMLDAGGERLTRAATCPLCFTPVSARDLRLVTARTLPRPDFDQPIEFTLLRRPRGSNLPTPVEAGIQTQAREHAVDPAAPLAAQPFAKFVATADCLPAFRRAAAALARQTADVVAEGGLEAEIEGPSLFKAMDVLATLGRAWRLRKGTHVPAGGGVVGADAEAAPPEEVAAADAVETVIREVFTSEMAASAAERAAAAEEERARAARAARDAALAHAFPTLGVGDSARAVGGSAKSAWGPRTGARGAGSAAGQQQRAERSSALLGDAAPGRGIDGDEVEADIDAAADVGGLQFELDELQVSDPGHRTGAGLSDADSVQDGAASPLLGCTPPSAAGGVTICSTPGSAGNATDATAATADLLLGTSPSAALSASALDAGAFHFYQAADGAPLYLHPLNVRALLNHYGAFSACPPRLSACVLEREHMTQTDALRRRLQPLAHLPLTADFTLCEVDLSPLLPDRALEPFADELAKREARRVKAAAVAAKEAAAAAAAEAAAVAARERPVLDLESMPRLSEVRTR